MTLGGSREENLTDPGGTLERQAVLRDQLVLYRRLFAGEPIRLGKREIRLAEPGESRSPPTRRMMPARPWARTAAT